MAQLRDEGFEFGHPTLSRLVLPGVESVVAVGADQVLAVNRPDLRQLLRLLECVFCEPAAEVDEHISNGAFNRQHGGRKMKSDTYWVRMTKQNRLRFASRQTASEVLREYVKRLV